MVRVFPAGARGRATRCSPGRATPAGESAAAVQCCPLLALLYCTSLYWVMELWCPALW